jgi:hypothetical protein
MSAPTPASNTTDPAPRMRLTTSNTTTSPNVSVADEVRFGHQDIKEPPPCDILSLGWAYILGNIGIGSDMSGISNVSSSLDTLDVNLSDRSVSESKRTHFRRHASFHQHYASRHPHDPRIEQPPNDPTTPFTNSLYKRVDGPIQCGPGPPCKDNSCCGSEGKCGHKEQNCGAGCIS